LRIENAIRSFAIDRKHWLFSDTVDETAKANRHELYNYLRYALQEIPKAASFKDFEKLLPYNLKPVNIVQDVVD